ncbi:MAG: hypothetical protein JWN70_6640 [Planctomycetaceae bacterium]|nr:hypothetical protein [Planctomycetaceae bacterium]
MRSRLYGRHVAPAVAIGVLILQIGCGRPTPSSTNSTSQPAPPAVASSPSDTIVTLTPRCAAELRQHIQQGASKQLVFIAVSKLPNVSLCRYELEFRDPTLANVILSSSQGIALAIDRDDAPFLKGTILDYLPDPGGFKFTNPREDYSLLSEYRAEQAEEARLRAIQAVQVKQINPIRATADLLTSRRQAAFEELQVWWKFHQTDAHSSGNSKVGRVDNYIPKRGTSITVVFTGDPEQQNGGVYLINPDGRQTRIFQGQNYLNGDDQFIDTNGDGLPEIVTSNDIGGHDENNPNKIVTDATSLCILPISAEQVPLLRIVFDVRRFKSNLTWRWKLLDRSMGTRDVVIEQQAVGNWTERARFVWSAEKSRYEGPHGSKSDGFIANSGNIETEQIKQFMKTPRTE